MQVNRVGAAAIAASGIGMFVLGAKGLAGQLDRRAAFAGGPNDAAHDAHAAIGVKIGATVAGIVSGAALIGFAALKLHNGAATTALTKMLGITAGIAGVASIGAHFGYGESRHTDPGAPRGVYDDLRSMFHEHLDFDGNGVFNAKDGDVNNPKGSSNYDVAYSKLKERTGKSDMSEHDVVHAYDSELAEGGMAAFDAKWDDFASKNEGISWLEDGVGYHEDIVGRADQVFEMLDANDDRSVSQFEVSFHSLPGLNR